MTTYNTGNPIGSTEVKDLYDNAQNFDTLANTTTLESVPDRLGVPRMTLHGFEQEAKRRFESIKFQPPIPYAPGIEVTTSSLTVDYLGVIYYALPSALPFTTGAWNPAQWSPVQNTNPGRELLVFDDYASASAAAATLPDGQVVDVAESNTRYDVYSGSLVNARPITPVSQIGGVVRSAQEKLQEFVSLSDYDTLRKALSYGKRVKVSALMTSIFVATEDSPFVLPFLHLIDAEGPLTINLASGEHITSSGDIAQVGQNANITLAGATPVSTSVSSVASVTGSLGNWAVTFNLDDATGIAVGDVLKVDNIKPGGPRTGTDAYVPGMGEIVVGFRSHGSFSATGGANTFTVSGSGLDTSIVPGDLIHVQGQTREVATVTSSGGTVTANWDMSVAALQWWYYSKPNTGTIEITGTAVNGIATSFTSHADVGDLLLVDGVMRKITAVGSDTSLTVTHALTVGAGAKFTILKAGLLHEGSFVVTNVAGNAVTVTNRSRYAKPPVVGITGGTAVAIKTVLRNTGTGGNGLVFDRGGILRSVTDIALRGLGSASAGIGIALNGLGQTYNQGNGCVTLEGSSAVIEWNRGVFIAGGAVFVGTNQHICNNFNTGVECTDGGDAYLRNAVVNHNNDIGLICSGGYARISNARICGNSLQGTRQEVGSGMYGDEPKTWGNGSHGFMLVNFCGIQFADGISAANGGNGANFQNGGGGRVSRTLFACNAQHNLSITNCKVEATQAWMTGAMAGQSGVSVSKSEVDLSNTAQTGNAAVGILSQANSRIDARNSHQTKNGTNGLRADDFTELLATGGRNSGNTGTDVSQTTGGVISYDLNPLGNHGQGSHFRQIITIADDAATSIYVGNNTIMLTLVSSSSATLYGLVRARAGTSASIALVTGTGIATSTGALAGTTGTDGNFTVSSATDGYLYFENRSGASRQITIDITGSIT